LSKSVQHRSSLSNPLSLPSANIWAGGSARAIGARWRTIITFWQHLSASWPDSCPPSTLLSRQKERRGCPGQALGMTTRRVRRSQALRYFVHHHLVGDAAQGGFLLDRL
jgi:hypothetical protein